MNPDVSTSDQPRSDVPPPPALAPTTTARNRVTLRVLTVAAFVVILNETIMSNAIPQLMQVFSVSAREAQWLSTGFMLTMAVVIPTTGWLLNRVGRRRAYLMAIGSFTVGTLICALAPAFAVLLFGRVVQACGTAIMMPLLMSSVLSLVPKNERGRVMGNVSLAISVAPALGPAISGVVLAFASWGWLFGLVMPVALLVLVLGYKLLEHGMQFTGMNPDRDLVEILELPEKRWFVGVQFHPEYKSSIGKPHPLFRSFVEACVEYARGKDLLERPRPPKRRSPAKLAAAKM